MVQTVSYTHLSTFFKNSANFGGGAIESWKSNITMDLCNITYKNAEHGGAIVFYGERVGNHVTGTLNIYNCTFEKCNAKYLIETNGEINNVIMRDNNICLLYTSRCV